jgi:hypothetical protein
LPEPFLRFRYGQEVHDPRDGLSLFGPADADSPGAPKSVAYGLVGTASGVARLREFAKCLRLPTVSQAASKNPRLWPAFPGFDIAFDCKFPEKEVRAFELDEAALVQASRINDANQRAFAVVEHYLNGIEDLKTKSDEQLSVVICVVPEQIWHNCRPKSVVFEGTGEVVTFKQRKLRAKGQTDLFEDVNFEPYQYAVDFRRQLKARSMGLGIPVQVVRESTLRTGDEFEFGQRGLTPLSDRAWNLGVALYYKSGGKPWRLSTARDGVCYVGLVYRKTDPIHGDRTACCAAQMFLETGDGIVLRSDFGPWYSPETKQFHLSNQEAKKLLTKVLSTYDSVGGKRLQEVFLHYRASISPEEYYAFKSVCPTNVKLVAIRVAADRYGVHLYREGTRPVIRGCFWKINERMGYLWASGFKPRLGTYDGMETPVPLRIEIEHGEADLMQVATDILGLTKLNYNECKYGDSAPVTIGFSESVGEILVSNPFVKDPNPRFKFYI